ncbi:Serine/threonine kinase TIP30/CC3 [Phaffia rhodozyma]|uniref:Serine/threonine kinase TIP30/CC3 n=1 Tax=Phaffia rhodozyma TaxID=264483 RepID=A0A0F7SJN6_PHARH|nr:Serine/threonine kinase TIP30/CC3 [Phaffia rhodozyma]
MTGTSLYLAGATGLTGSHTLRAGLASHLATITTFSRRPINTPTTTPSTVAHRSIVLDFDHPETWPDIFSEPSGQPTGEQKGKVFASCLGTTREAAGTLENQRKIDYDLNLSLAKKAKEAGVDTYILVSTGMASSKTRFAYLRMKGELEDAVRDLNFKSTYILQPGLLYGQREEKRMAEGWSQFLFNGLKSVGLPMGRYSIDAEVIGECITKLALAPKDGVHVLSNMEILAFVKK